MNLKLKAVLFTSLVLLGTVVIAFGMAQLPTWAIGVIAVAFAAHIMYSIILTKLEYDIKLDEINKKYQK